MAFIDVLKFRGPNNALVWKWEPDKSGWGRRNEELRMGTQLVVNPSFLAVFVNGGQIADIFAPGTYTLSTKNLPILDRLITLPLGGQSPFKAEVYYINKAVLMDIKFDVSSFNIKDPNLKVPIPLSCVGSFAIRVGEAKLFLTKIFGNLDVLTPDKLKEYFRDLISEKVKSAIGDVVRRENWEPMELETAGGKVTELITPSLKETLEKYGVILELFNIDRISINYDDSRAKKAIEKYQEINAAIYAERLGYDVKKGENLAVYDTIRKYDTTEAIANSIGKGGTGGGETGGIMGTIIGMGMAQPIANAMGGVINKTFSGQTQQESYSQRQPTTQNIPSNSDNLLASLRELSAMHEKGHLTDEEYTNFKHILLNKYASQ